MRASKPQWNPSQKQELSIRALENIPSYPYVIIRAPRKPFFLRAAIKIELLGLGTLKAVW